MKLPACLLLCLFSLPALSAPATTVPASSDVLRRCRALGDPAARLACYDALVIESAPERSGPPPAAAAATLAAPAPATVAAAAAVSTPPAADPARFGFENKSGPLQEITSIRSRITGAFDCWNGNARIRLDNGQVWQVTDGSSTYCELRNPAVVVRRAALGSFMLEIEGVRLAPRVRRVE